MLKYTVSRNKDGILGENPETKKIYMQVIPWGRRLHVCSQKVKEKAFLTWNENTLKSDVSGGKRSLRKTRRIKVQWELRQREILWPSGEKCRPSLSNKKGEEHHNHMAVKFTQKVLRTQIWFARTGSLHAWDWVWTTSKFLPAVIHAQAEMWATHKDTGIL